MLDMHATEEEIHQYLLDGLKANERFAEHILLCEKCKAKVAAYQLLFNGLKEIEKPLFEFNLDELVLAQLPNQKTTIRKDSLTIFLSVCVLILIGASGYMFREYLAALFAGLASVSGYLMAASMGVILFFFCLDMYKNYQKKMRALDFN